MKSWLLLGVSLLPLIGCGGDVDRPASQTISLAPSLVMRISQVEAGDHCHLGGRRIEEGLDRNHSGQLDDNEVLTTEYVCKGVDTSEKPTFITSLAMKSLYSAA